MDDAFFMGGGEAVGDLHSVLDGFALRHQAAIEQGAEAFSLEQFGHDEGRAFLLADVMNGEDVRVIERGHGARLLLEATETVGFAGEGLGNNFQSDIAAEASIARAIDLAHASGAEGARIS